MINPERKEPVKLGIKLVDLERINNLLADSLFRASRALLSREKQPEDLGKLQADINNVLTGKGYTSLDLDVAHKVADGVAELVLIPNEQ